MEKLIAFFQLLKLNGFREVSKSAEGIVQLAGTFKGITRKAYPDYEGEIYFVLLTEMGLDVLPNQDFTLRGPGINLSDQTDENGEFRQSPVELGEYELEVGMMVLNITALGPGSRPYPVQVPYALLLKPRQPKSSNEEMSDTIKDQNMKTPEESDKNSALKGR